MELNIYFQKTELGNVPIDWQELKFEDVLVGFSSGATPYRARTEYYNGNIRWITSGELNYNKILDTEEKITDEAVKNTNLKMLPVGTFLMAITGLEAEGTRGSCAIIGAESTTNQSCMALLPKDNKILSEYLFQFYIQFGEYLAFKYCQGTKQQSYNGTIVKKLPIVLPPTIDEQKAIATALSDIDELITSLDKLINKKRNIKQATMQQLLTGKKRLPGFSGKWEEKTLGEIGDCIIGLTYQPSDIHYKGKLVLRSSNISDNILEYEDNVFVQKEIPVKLVLKINDILVCVRNGSRNLIGKSALINGRAVGETFGAFMAVFRSAFNNFIIHLFQSDLIKRQIDEHLGATINQITNKSLKSFIIPLPHVNEQKAIAKILSNMDNEIATLEMKQNKYKKIKQGMMQQLLTGKVRLVDGSGNVKTE